MEASETIVDVEIIEKCSCNVPMNINDETKISPAVNQLADTTPDVLARRSSRFPDDRRDSGGSLRWRAAKHPRWITLLTTTARFPIHQAPR